MRNQHIGYRIKGFYKIAFFSNKMEAMMATDAKQKLNALEFWNKHGLNATQDFVGVSRSTLYRWKKRFDEGGVSALRDASKARRRFSRSESGFHHEQLCDGFCFRRWSCRRFGRFK